MSHLGDTLDVLDCEAVLRELSKPLSDLFTIVTLDALRQVHQELVTCLDGKAPAT